MASPPEVRIPSDLVITNPATRRALTTLGYDPDDPAVVARASAMGMTLGAQPATGMGGNIGAFFSGAFRNVENTARGLADLPLAIGREFGIASPDTRIEAREPSHLERANPVASGLGELGATLGQFLVPEALIARGLGGAARGHAIYRGLRGAGARPSLARVATRLGTRIPTSALSFGAFEAAQPGDIVERFQAFGHGAKVGATMAALAAPPGVSRARATLQEGLGATVAFEGGPVIPALPLPGAVQSFVFGALGGAATARPRKTPKTPGARPGAPPKPLETTIRSSEPVFDLDTPAGPPRPSLFEAARMTEVASPEAPAAARARVESASRVRNRERYIELDEPHANEIARRTDELNRELMGIIPDPIARERAVRSRIEAELEARGEPPPIPSGRAREPEPVASQFREGPSREPVRVPETKPRGPGDEPIVSPPARESNYPPTREPFEPREAVVLDDAQINRAWRASNPSDLELRFGEAGRRMQDIIDREAPPVTRDPAPRALEPREPIIERVVATTRPIIPDAREVARTSEPGVVVIPRPSEIITPTHGETIRFGNVKIPRDADAHATALLEGLEIPRPETTRVALHTASERIVHPSDREVIRINDERSRFESRVDDLAATIRRICEENKA